MENRGLLTLLTVTVFLQITLCAVPKMQLVLTSIEQCKDKEDLPITINHWEIIQREKSSFYLTGNINVTQEFPEGFDGMIEMWLSNYRKKILNPTHA